MTRLVSVALAGTALGVPGEGGSSGRIAVGVVARDGSLDVVLVPADGSWARPLVTGGGDDFSPSLSPTSARLAFRRNRDGNPEVYVARADGRGAVNLSRDPGDDFSPAWSPDGRRLAFASRGGGSSLYVVDLTTRRARRPTRGSDERPGVVAVRSGDRLPARRPHRDRVARRGRVPLPRDGSIGRRARELGPVSRPSACRRLSEREGQPLFVRPDPGGLQLTLSRRPGRRGEALGGPLRVGRSAAAVRNHGVARIERFPASPVHSLFAAALASAWGIDVPA